MYTEIYEQFTYFKGLYAASNCCTSFYNLKPNKQHVHGGERRDRSRWVGNIVLEELLLTSFKPLLLYIRLSGAPRKRTAIKTILVQSKCTIYKVLK